MTTDFAGDPSTFPALIKTPSDGEDRDANSVQVPLEQLADRTANLSKFGGSGFAARNWSASGEPTTITNNTQVKQVAGNGAIWVAAGISSSSPGLIMATTQPSASWVTATTIPFTDDWRVVSWDPTNSLFITAGDQGRLATASDPYGTWAGQTISIFTALSITAMGTSSTASVIAGPYDGSARMAAARSTNGTTWATITTFPGSSGDIVWDLTYSGTTWVAVGQVSGPSPAIWLSTDDGVTFASVTVPGGLTSDELVGITHDGQRFVAIGDDGSVITSITGATGTWTVLAGPPITLSTSLPGCIKADPVSGVIVVISPNVVNASFWISEDTGVTWTIVPHTPAIPIGITNVPGKSVWFHLGFDGTAWASVGSNAGTDDKMYGTQTLIMG